ncbi:MAG: MarR family transcriptional regulator [Pseudomonadota bacterium]
MLAVLIEAERMNAPKLQTPAQATGSDEGSPGEAELRQAIELLFFAYRDFTGDPDAVLAGRGLGRAHHRAVHFINRSPGITVAGLLDILRVTKQSLNRVLRQLIAEGLVESREGKIDRRQRNLFLTEAGRELERELSALQRDRVGRALRDAGPEATSGFRDVLSQMIDSESRATVLDLIKRGAA